MKSPKSPVSLEELTNGYCLAVANAFRLVEDGEKLYGLKRYNGASGLFRDAVNEIAKAYLISTAVMLDDSDEAGWHLFWLRFHGWREKLELLQKDVHPKIYKSPEAKNRYKKAHDILEIDFTRLTFHEKTKQFTPPGGNLLGHGNDQKLANMLYEYMLGLFHAFNFGGLPDPKSQYQTFHAMKMYPEKV